MTIPGTSSLGLSFLETESEIDFHEEKEWKISLVDIPIRNEGGRTWQ